MSKRARAFSLARELKHADSECYGEPVDVDALVLGRGGDARQTQDVALSDRLGHNEKEHESD